MPPHGTPTTSKLHSSDKQTMWYVITSAATMVKSHEKKKMLKLFSYNYNHYDVVKCYQNLKLEKMDTAPYTGKNDGFLVTVRNI